MIQITTVKFRVSDPTGSHDLRLSSAQPLNWILAYCLLWWFLFNPFLAYHHRG